MLVRDIMTHNLAVISPESTVEQAAKMMQAHNIGSVPVCGQNGQIVGIVTDRDIVVRNLASGHDPKSTKVNDIMTKDVITAFEEMDVDEAAKVMSERKIRRLPVIKQGKVSGMVALGDLATRYIFADEAGEALGDISEPSKPENIVQ